MSRNKKMILFLLIGVVLIIIACIGVYFYLFARANPPLKTGQVTIGNNVFNVEIASTTVEQARGLSFRTSLAAADGMLFVFGSSSIKSFWMKDMNFSLDMIWIGSGKVLGFAQNAEPQPGAALWNLTIYNSPDGTNQVLEVDAGTVAKDNITIGDPVRLGTGN